MVEMLTLAIDSFIIIPSLQLKRWIKSNSQWHTWILPFTFGFISLIINHLIFHLLFYWCCGIDIVRSQTKSQGKNPFTLYPPSTAIFCSVM
jgi:hypothetical protein